MENFALLGILIAVLYPAFLLVCTFYILRRAGFDHILLMFIPVFQDVVFFLAAGFWKIPIVMRSILFLIQAWFLFYGAAQFDLHGGHYFLLLYVIYTLCTGIGLAFLSVQLGKSFLYGILSVLPIIQLWVYADLAFRGYKPKEKKQKIKVMNHEKLEKLLQECVDHDMTDEEILESTKRQKVSVAQVKRMLFDLRKKH